MSTSLVHHGFGIKGYQHVHSKYHDGAIHFRVQQGSFPSAVRNAAPIRLSAGVW